MVTQSATNQISRRTLLRTGSQLGVAALLGSALGSRAFAEAPKFKTVEDGYVTVAMTGGMPTSGFVDGKLMGSDVEIIIAIADKLGLKVKPNIMQWSSTIQSIKSGRADVMCGDMSWTKERAQTLLLTNPIYYEINSITMRKEVQATEPFDLDKIGGHSVGTGTGFYGVPDLKSIPGVTEVKLYDTTDAAIRDLVAGRVDFASLDSMDIDYLIAQQPDIDLKLLVIKNDPKYPKLSGKGISVLGMSPDNPDLFDAFNAGLKWLWDTKQIGPIIQRNGLKNPEYLVPPTTNPRIGVDRDEKGNIIGLAAHTPKDFSSLFS